MKVHRHGNLVRRWPGIAAVILAGAVAACGTGSGRGPTPEQCTQIYQGCLNSCEARSSSAEVAGCKTRCVAQKASCKTEAKYNQAEPWVERQADKVGDFIDGASGN